MHDFRPLLCNDRDRKGLFFPTRFLSSSLPRPSLLACLFDCLTCSIKRRKRRDELSSRHHGDEDGDCARRSRSRRRRGETRRGTSSGRSHRGGGASGKGKEMYVTMTTSAFHFLNPLYTYGLYVVGFYAEPRKSRVAILVCRRRASHAT